MEQGGVLVSGAAQTARLPTEPRSVACLASRPWLGGFCSAPCCRGAGGREEPKQHTSLERAACSVRQLTAEPVLAAARCTPLYRATTARGRPSSSRPPTRRRHWARPSLGGRHQVAAAQPRPTAPPAARAPCLPPAQPPPAAFPRYGFTSLSPTARRPRCVGRPVCRRASAMLACGWLV